MTALPLAGLVVADFSRILAGPFCTMMLADAGARVIKIEDPQSGDETRRWGPPFLGDVSAYYLSANRGKDVRAIDLKSTAGRREARELIAEADIVVDNFLDPQKERLGLRAEDVREINQRAIHCSIRGFDRDSPEADLPGFDLLAQAAGGLMSITGEPDGRPMKVGVALADVLTAHYAHGAILHSLYARERTGEGASIEVSLFGCTVASLINVGQSYLVTGDEPKRYGNQHPSIVPYQTFVARDGDVAIGAASDRQFEALCREALESPEVADDVRFAVNAGRVAHRHELSEAIGAITATMSVEEIVRRCRSVSVPAAPVARISQILGDRQRPGRPVARFPSEAGEIEMVRSPIVRDGLRYGVPGGRAAGPMSRSRPGSGR